MARQDELTQDALDRMLEWISEQHGSGTLVGMLLQEIDRTLVTQVRRIQELEDRQTRTSTRRAPPALDAKTTRAPNFPFCHPEPKILFAGKTFTLTGGFDYGTRGECESAIVARGGKIARLSGSVDYLVVGAKGSRAWKHGDYGQKINKAVRWRDEGKGLAIVTEARWRSALTNDV